MRKGTPPEVVARLEEALRKTVTSPEFKAVRRRIGFLPAYQPGEPLLKKIVAGGRGNREDDAEAGGDPGEVDSPRTAPDAEADQRRLRDDQNTDQERLRSLHGPRHRGPENR